MSLIKTLPPPTQRRPPHSYRKHLWKTHLLTMQDFSMKSRGVCFMWVWTHLCVNNVGWQRDTKDHKGCWLRFFAPLHGKQKNNRDGWYITFQAAGINWKIERLHLRKFCAQHDKRTPKNNPHTSALLCMQMTQQTKSHKNVPTQTATNLLCLLTSKPQMIQHNCVWLPGGHVTAANSRDASPFDPVSFMEIIGNKVNTLKHKTDFYNFGSKTSRSGYIQLKNIKSGSEIDFTWNG